MYQQKETPASMGMNTLSAHLYRRYASKLLAYLRRHLLALEDAEDLLLDVFIAVLENEPGLRVLQEDEQRAWLWTVARNKLIDYHRRTARRPVMPLDSIAEQVDEQQKDPQAILLADVEIARLQTFLRRLPASQQEVIFLRFSSELRCSEIAVVLRKRDGAVRTMLSRALTTLRTFFRGDDYDE